MQNNLRGLQDVLDANWSAMQITFAPQFLLNFVWLFFQFGEKIRWRWFQYPRMELLLRTRQVWKGILQIFLFFT